MKSVSRIKTKGFTIVELLTVMGVIVVLISLLLPALSMVRDFSDEIQQKAQFHSIEVGIGMYENDFGNLPPSHDNYDDKRAEGVPTADGSGEENDNYTGAMKLAEAMVGMDMLGFHPNSGFYPDGINQVRYTDNSGTLQTDLLDIYTADDTMEYADWQTAEENLDARKGPYLDMENANAYKLAKVYGINNIGNFDGPDYFDDGADGPVVLCDVFSEKRRSGEKTGSPILYFKARTRFSQQDWEEEENTNDDYLADEDDIYYALDNYSLIDLGVAGKDNENHPVLENSSDGYGIDEFQKLIINDKVTSINRPFRASSYILWSAGKDGLYGTADDIFNFDKRED